MGLFYSIFSNLCTMLNKRTESSARLKRLQSIIIMEKELLQQLDRIERNSLLAAKNVLTLEDAALITGLSKSYFYKLTSSNQVPHYKPHGKQVYFDRAELENWMKQNRIATGQEIEEIATNYIVTGKFKANN